MLEIRAKASEACHDRLARLWMQTHLAGQRQQFQRGLKINGLRGETLRNTRPRRLLTLAALHIRAEAPHLQADFLTCFGIDAKHTWFGRCAVLAASELARIAALRIIRTADKGAEFPQLQIQRATAAGGAD